MLLSFLKEGMSSFVGPRSSMLGGRGGLEGWRNSFGALMGAFSTSSLC
jgi:hypothetical protein